jgi:hypothetical protein
MKSRGRKLTYSERDEIRKQLASGNAKCPDDGSTLEAAQYSSRQVDGIDRQVVHLQCGICGLYGRVLL